MTRAFNKALKAAMTNVAAAFLNRQFRGYSLEECVFYNTTRSLSNEIGWATIQGLVTTAHITVSDFSHSRA